jgi:hypothetical protein
MKTAAAVLGLLLVGRMRRLVRRGACTRDGKLSGALARLAERRAGERGSGLVA